MLDFETRPVLHLVVVAQADSSSAGSPLYGYCDVWVHLQDRNDNAPRFTQQQYSASVWEGNNKGTFVMQVSVCVQGHRPSTGELPENLCAIFMEDIKYC